MKLRSLAFFLALYALSICATVHTAHQSGFVAAFACFAVLDIALIALISPLFGVRPKGMLYAQANALGTLAATGVFHDALGLLLKRLPFLARLASDIAPTMGFQNMPFNVAQILKNYNATHTVSDRSATGTYAKQAGIAALGDQNFTLNAWPYISFGFTLLELNQMIDSATNADARQIVINKLWTKAFNALGIQIVTDFLAVITAGNFAQSYAIPAATGDYKKLGSAIDVFLQNDALGMEAPDGIFSITLFRTLANSLTAIPNNTFDSGRIINTGVISEPISGCQSLTRYNLNMPADAANGVLLDPQGIVFANRVPLEESLPNDPVYTEIVTDPATGFSILLREAKDALTGEVTRTITTMYGFAPGLAQHVTRITEA